MIDKIPRNGCVALVAILVTFMGVSAASADLLIPIANGLSSDPGDTSASYPTILTSFQSSSFTETDSSSGATFFIGGTSDGVSWGSELVIKITHDASGASIEVSGNGSIGTGNLGFSNAGGSHGSNTITVPWSTPIVDSSGTYTVEFSEAFNDAGVDFTFANNSFISVVPDPRSVLRIEEIRREGTDIVIRFEAAPDRAYEIRSGTDLIAFPTLVQTIAATATGGMRIVTDFGATSLPERFYRIFLLP